MTLNQQFSLFLLWYCLVSPRQLSFCLKFLLQKGKENCFASIQSVISPEQTFTWWMMPMPKIRVMRLHHCKPLHEGPAKPSNHLTSSCKNQELHCSVSSRTTIIAPKPWRINWCFCGPHKRKYVACLEFYGEQCAQFMLVLLGYRN